MDTSKLLRSQAAEEGVAGNEGAEKDDLLYDGSQCTREQQLNMRDLLKQAGPAEDDDMEQEEQQKKTPGRPKGATAKAKAKAKAKVKAKAKAKAKAKSKGASAKAEAKATAGRKKLASANNEAGTCEDPEPDCEDEDVPEDKPPKRKGEVIATLPKKAKATAKAKSKGVTSEDEKAEHETQPDQGGDKKDEADHDEAEGVANGQKKQKKTFARRYEPERDLVAQCRWKCIKEAYELNIAPKLARPLSQEDTSGLDACMQSVQELIHTFSPCGGSVLEALYGYRAGG